MWGEHMQLMCCFLNDQFTDKCTCQWFVCEWCCVCTSYSQHVSMYQQSYISALPAPDRGKGVTNWCTSVHLMRRLVN